MKFKLLIVFSVIISAKSFCKADGSSSATQTTINVCSSPTGCGNQSTTANAQCPSTSPSTQDVANACQGAVAACNILNPQQAALISTALSSASGSLSNSSSGQVACQVGEMLSSSMSIASLALAASCEMKVKECSNQVQSALPAAQTRARSEDLTVQSDGQKAVQDLNHDKAICATQGGNVVSNVFQALTYMQSYANDAQCVAYWKAVKAAANATPKPCAERPTDSDCVCVINPRNPTCFGYSSGGGAQTSSNLGSGTDTSTADNPANSAQVPIVPTGGAQAGGPSGPGGSGGGGGGPALTGGGKMSPEDQGQQAAGPYKTDILNGTSSGSGGNPFASKGSDGSGSDNSSMLSRLAAGLNLKKFLPGSDYKNRGPASVDGLTGANGPSLFDKVSSRYSVKKGEMVP